MKLFLSLAALAATLVAPAATSAEDEISVLLDKAADVYKEKGFKPTGFEHRGTLKQGESETVPVTLKGGGSYQVIGVCDTGCENLDIQLLDAAGTVVDKDDQDDDFPIVAASGGGSFTAKVVMAKCGAASCAWGMRAYTQ